MVSDVLLICKLEKEEGIYGRGPRDLKVTSGAIKPLASKPTGFG